MQQGQSPFEDDLTLAIKPREFICPCGKSYQSYPALYTHIKNKHNGRAPGKISKPPSLHEKRGRPPVRPRSQPSPAQLPNPPNSELYPSETPEEQQRREARAEQALDMLAQFLALMPKEPLNKTQLNEIEAFAQMSVRLSTRTEPCYLEGTICLADGLLEFCRGICLRLDWWQFQNLYVLFMLFLKFLMDSENNKSLLLEGTLDIMCQEANQFVESHMKQMAEYFQLESMWLMQRQNCVSILHNFFNWCSLKHYITYRITISENERSQGTQVNQQIASI